MFVKSLVISILQPSRYSPDGKSVLPCFPPFVFPCTLSLCRCRKAACTRQPHSEHFSSKLTACFDPKVNWRGFSQSYF